MSSISEMQHKVRQANKLRITNNDKDSEEEQLNMSSYSGVVEYFPEELVITLKAGTTIDEVNKIIADELAEYCTWLHEAPLRALLHKYKIAITKEVNLYFEDDKEAEKIKDITNQVMRKLMSKPEVLVSSSKPDTLIAEQVSKICIGYFI